MRPKELHLEIVTYSWNSFSRLREKNDVRSALCCGGHTNWYLSLSHMDLMSPEPPSLFDPGASENGNMTRSRGFLESQRRQRACCASMSGETGEDSGFWRIHAATILGCIAHTTERRVRLSSVPKYLF